MIFSLFLVFITVVVALTYLDWKLWGTLFTPVIVLAWPFMILLMMDCLYMESNYKSFKLNENVLIVWIIGLLCFWLPGVLIKLLFKKIKVDNVQLQSYSEEISISRYKLRLLFCIAYPLIILVAYKVYTFLVQFDFNIGDEDFQQNLGSGFIGHSILLLTLISIFLIIFFNKEYYKIHQVLIIIVTLILSILYGVKSWIIIPLISAFLGRLLLKKTKFGLKHVLVVVLPFFVFWLIYQISFGFNAGSNEYIFGHMEDYLLAGPIGLSEHFNQGFPIGSNPEYAFTPINNIFRFLFRENSISPISVYFLSIPTGFETNVKTFFGTLYIYGGYSYTLTSFVFGILFYLYLLVFCYASRLQIAPFITTLYVFMLGLLFMGWFEVYVIHLSFYEAPIWIFLLYLLFKLKIQDEDFAAG